MKYNSIVQQYFFQQRYAGKLDGESILLGRAGVPENGAVIVFYLQCEKQRIVNISYCAFGSPILLALGEYVCEHLMGRSINDIAALSDDVLMQALDLTAMQSSFVVMVRQALGNILA